MAKFSSTKRMKELINDEQNVMDTVELRLSGVQAYNVDCETEYNVIIRAERHYNGRYFFVTREHYYVAWSTLTKEQVEQICTDMLDQRAEEDTYIINRMNCLRNNGSCLVDARVMNDIYHLCDEFNLSVSIEQTGADETGRALYHIAVIDNKELSTEETADSTDEEDTESSEQTAGHQEPETKLYLYAYQNGEQKSRRESTVQEFTQMAELFADVMQNIMHYSVDYLPGADRITWTDTDGNITDIMIR